MKKSFLSFLMVAMIATITFAFAPKADFADAVYRYVSGNWEEGTGTNCGGSAALCQISFNTIHDAYAPKIFAQITTQAAGTFSIFVDHDNNSSTPLVEVVVTLSRKTS